MQTKKGKLKTKEENEGRIAIINEERCKPKKCQFECKVACPVNRADKVCVKVERNSKSSYIDEILCVGCGMCVKKCPFEAIKIINLPKNLPDEASHRYGHNRFVLYKLPTPRIGSILGLIGTNGIGKTTALQILTNKIQPNLGRIDDPPEWSEVIKHYKGTEIHNYFLKLIEEKAKSAFKMQLVDEIPKAISGKVSTFIQKKDQRNLSEELVELFDMKNLMDREIGQLSGGELQRFAILITLLQNVKIYIFDEPTSYLDVKQRLTISKAIRKYAASEMDETYVILVEHDLSILDFLSDHICCLFGRQAAFGVVSLPYAVKEGINAFLEGFLPKENMRTREYALNFRNNEWATEDDPKPENEEEKEDNEEEEAPKKEDEPKDPKAKAKAESSDEDGEAKGKKEKKGKSKKEDKDAKSKKPKKEEDKKEKEVKDEKDAKKEAAEPEKEYFMYNYPKFKKRFKNFNLTVMPGGFSTSQIYVLLGENGTGKTTFVRILAGLDKEIEGDLSELPKLSVSLKPQTISPSSEGTVLELLTKRLGGLWATTGIYKQVVFDQMNIEPLFSQEVKKLSGGEVQRVGLVVALGKPADLYLIDEPSAYLDVEQRIVTAKVIKKFIYLIKKTAFIVEHDFIMATYMADKFIVYEGTPGQDCMANSPMSVVEGMNKFLSILGITFRRDAHNFRPRINKLNSQLDKEQKLSGNYFFVEKD